MPQCDLAAVEELGKQASRAAIDRNADKALQVQEKQVTSQREPT